MLFGFLSNRQKSITKHFTHFLGFKPNKISRYVDIVEYFSGDVSCSNINNKKFSQYERLEFLGDSVLGAIVSSFLIKKYPTFNEGYLTEMKSKIVNRNQLNNIAQKLKIVNLCSFSSDKSNLHKDIHGNTLEALIGAIFFDKGLYTTSKWVKENILSNIDFKELEKLETNPKSKVYDWCSKNEKEISITYDEKIDDNKKNNFTANLHINNKFITSHTGTNKKDAGMYACEKAIEILNI